MDHEAFKEWELCGSHDEDLERLFYFDEFHEMTSFDNTSSTINNNAAVITDVPFGSSSRRLEEMSLAVVPGDSRLTLGDQMEIIATATQRLKELDMGGKSGEPTVVYGRSRGLYVCARMGCSNRSPPELQLPANMDFYCTWHYAKGRDVWRMQCVGRTQRDMQCSLRDYRVLHPGVARDEYRCNLHWPTMRGRIFRARSSYNPKQHLLSSSSSVGTACKLLRDQALLPCFIDKDVCDSHCIHVTLNRWHRTVFSGKQFDDLTQGFDPVLKENIRHLVVDYFRLLEANFHQERRLEYSGSIIGWRDKNDNRADLIAECLKRGNIYFLLYKPESLVCKKPQDSIAIKIGNTRDKGKRIDRHRAQCRVQFQHFFEFPETGDIPFAYLLEEIVYEMLRAHQYDIVCHCGTTHTELYWFHQVSGSEKYQHKIFYAIVRTLAPIVQHWIAAIRNLQHLHAELQHAHLSTLALQEVMARW